MSEASKIEWVDHTASPWHGCTHGVYDDADGNEHEHPGCLHCYAEKMAKRNPGVLGVWGRDGTRIMSASFHDNCRRWNAAAEKAGKRASVFPSICDPFEQWDGPVSNAKGDLLWVNETIGSYEVDDGQEGFAFRRRWATMSDLRRDLFTTIDACPWLDFVLLTKRPGNVREMWQPSVASSNPKDNVVAKEQCSIPACRRAGMSYYRPNVFLLTSISDQATADALIPQLLECRDLVPVLGLSAEPLLGPVNLTRISLRDHGRLPTKASNALGDWVDPLAGAFTNSPTIDWVIVGGESGHGARPMHLDWARSIRDQCQAAGVPFFFKQWGEWAPNDVCANPAASWEPIGVSKALTHIKIWPGRDEVSYRIGKKAAGRILDGRMWDEMPNRQY